MHCWSCGAPNPNENTFCGKCGKRIASTAASFANTEDSRVPVEKKNAPVAEAPPLPKNPMVEEPRAVHDSPRTLTQMEIATPPPPREEMKRVEEIRRGHALPPNRITGPSFLGLSDESTSGSESSYLLEDDQPERSSWRAWLALAVLALFGFLIYKHWSTVRDGAIALTRPATAQSTKPSTTPPPAPQGNITSAAAPDSASGATPTESASSAGPTETSRPSTAPPANPDALDKPENDRTSYPQKARSNAKSDLDKPAENAESAENADEPDAADAMTAERAPAKTAAKRAAPEPAEQFSSAPVDEAERYLSGRGVSQDCSRAISLLRSAAREGNPRAQVKLGALYATGQCVTQDRAAAYQWLARAQETQPHNSYLQRSMNSLWANMTPQERDRITR